MIKSFIRLILINIEEDVCHRFLIYQNVNYQLVKFLPMEFVSRNIRY